MPAVYKGASQHNLLWIGIAFAGLAAQLLTMWALNALGLADGLGLWVFLISSFPFLSALGFGWWLLAKFNRERLGGIRILLESKGFLVTTQPAPEIKETFYPSMAGIFAAWGADRGSDPVQWIALNEQAENRRAVMEYQYVTGSGKFRQEHSFTVLAWPSSHPEFPSLLTDLPFVCLWRMPWWARGLVRRSEALVLPGMETFQKEWFVTGDATTACRLLTPLLMTALERSPRNEQWYLGNGWACACAKVTLDAPNLSRFMEHAQQTLKSVC